MWRLEAVRQAEANECGLAALTMVARRLGHDIDLAWARQRFPATRRRPDLASILGMARSLGLDARALKAEVEDLARLRLPAILHWELRHFVVLARAGRRHVDICDPAAGRPTLSMLWMGYRWNRTGISQSVRRISSESRCISTAPGRPSMDFGDPTESS
jgi:ATP-binding cassette subfamily B protein RaxB